MARRARRRRNPEAAHQFTFGERYPARRTAFGEDSGPFIGPVERESTVRRGRRARGRGRATVYGPVKSPSAYKPQRRKKAPTRKRRRARKGRQPVALRRYWAARRAAAKRARKTTKRGRSRRKGRMPAGLRRYWAAHRRAVKGAKRRHGPGYTRAALRRASKRSRKHLRATRTIRPGQRIAGRVIRNPKGAHTMSRKRRGRRHHNRRRNPGTMIDSLKFTAATAVPAVAGGAVMSFVDGKLLAGRSQVIQIGAKLALAAAASLALRKRPITAASLVGGLLGQVGYAFGAKLQGGVQTASATATTQAMGMLIREDPYARRVMSALIDSSGGAVVTPRLHGMGAGTVLPDYPVGLDVNLG